MSLGPLRTRGWLPRGRLARRTRGLLLGGVWLRYVTWGQARELDDQLAWGTDPIASDELSLRVGQLGSARSRGRFARVLRGAVASRICHSTRSVLGRRDTARPVQENRELLLELAARLGPAEPGLQGLAITSLLVGDGFSPLFSKAAQAAR